MQKHKKINLIRKCLIKVTKAKTLTANNFQNLTCSHFTLWSVFNRNQHVHTHAHTCKSLLYLQTLATHVFMKLFQASAGRTLQSKTKPVLFKFLNSWQFRHRRLFLMKGFGIDALTQSFPASKYAAFPAKMAAVHFYQIVGRTYRGETQAVTSARNVFYCLLRCSIQCIPRVLDLVGE